MEYIGVGKIITTHGIKGEVKVLPFSDDFDRFSYLEKVYIGDKKLEANVVRSRVHKNAVILEFKEYTNINEVLLFKDQNIYVDEESTKKLEEDEYFIFDLVGCKVYDMKDIYIGDIKEVLQGFGNDLYIIKNDDKEYMVPAVKEFVKEVDVDSKKIIIDPIDGLIE